MTWVSLDKDQGVRRALFLLKALREKPFPCPCQLLETAQIPGLVAPYSTFKASSRGLNSSAITSHHYHHLHSVSLVYFKDPMIPSGPPRESLIISISRFLWALPLHPHVSVVERLAGWCAGGPGKTTLPWVAGAGLRVQGRLAGLAQRPSSLTSTLHGLDTHGDQDSGVPHSDLYFPSHMLVRCSSSPLWTSTSVHFLYLFVCRLHLSLWTSPADV